MKNHGEYGRFCVTGKRLLLTYLEEKLGNFRLMSLGSVPGKIMQRLGMELISELVKGQGGNQKQVGMYIRANHALPAQ